MTYDEHVRDELLRLIEETSRHLDECDPLAGVKLMRQVDVKFGLLFGNSSNRTAPAVDGAVNEA